MHLVKKLYKNLTPEELFYRAFQITRCDIASLKLNTTK